MQNLQENVCNSIRKKLGYSIGDMAALLGLSKATYQCYDNNSRKIPDAVGVAVIRLYQKDREFFKRYSPGGDFDKEIAELYPNGFLGASDENSV